MAEFVLETARLVLRRPVEGDAEALFRITNTPAVMAHLGGVQTLEQIAQRQAQARDSFAREGFGFMMLIEKTSGELVGRCGLKRVTTELAPNVGDHEVGWMVREDRWRRGYAGEAIGAVLDWAFGPIGAPHVVALTSASNVPSWRLMEKLGMERRPELDFADPEYPPEDNPTIVYRLTAAQWRAGR